MKDEPKNEFLSAAKFIDNGGKVSYGFATMPDGTKLRLRSLSETERASEVDGWVNKTKLKIAGQNRDRFFRCRLVQLCAVDADGNQLFTEDQIPQIAEVKSGWVARASAEAMKICGMTNDDVEAEVKN